MELKPVAMYREMYSDRYQDLPSLRTADAGVVEEDRDRILDYMYNVPAVFDVMGSVPDLLTEGEWISGGSSLYSDGVWIWREDSMRYVATGAVGLPADFVAHVRAGDYRPAGFDTRDPEFDAAFMAYF
ncbi:hypothetical protein [Nocardia thailandica]